MLTTLLLLPVQSPPKDEDVVAGWLGFWVLMALIAATAFLCWNFTKQLKKAKAAKDAGAFGDEPKDAGARGAED